MAATAKDEAGSDTKEFGCTIELQDSNARIAELAYYKAESRGLELGHELDDWLEAEQEFIREVGST